MAAFAELGVMGEIIRALEGIGWMLPTPIQQEAIPLILGGGDVMGAAETGTGKTGAFGIPLIQLIHESLTGAEPGGADKGREKPEIQMSMEDKEALFNIDAGGSMCSATSQAAWAGGRANICIKQGKYFFEVSCVQVSGTVRVGVATGGAAYNLGTCANGFGFGGTAKKSNGGKFVDFGRPYSEGDCVGCYLDLAANTIGFTHNGADMGPAFDLPAHLKGKGFYPAICLKCSVVAVNFGATPFKYAPPAGFLPLAQAAPAHVMFSAEQGAGGSAGATPLAILLEPSRDLAEQTFQCLQDYKKHMSAPRIAAMLAVGGVDLAAQVRELKQGAHIVVGTPGRIEDLVKGGKLSCAKVRTHACVCVCVCVCLHTDWQAVECTGALLCAGRSRPAAGDGKSGDDNEPIRTPQQIALWRRTTADPHVLCHAAFARNQGVYMSSCAHTHTHADTRTCARAHALAHMHTRTHLLTTFVPVC